MVEEGRAEAEKVFQEMLAKGREEGERQYQVDKSTRKLVKNNKKNSMNRKNWRRVLWRGKQCAQTFVLFLTFIIMEFEKIDTKVSITLSKIMKTIVCPTQMINIACQNVTEGTDSFDFCEVSFHDQSSKLQTEEQ